MQVGSSSVRGALPSSDDTRVDAVIAETERRMKEENEDESKKAEFWTADDDYVKFSIQGSRRAPKD